MSHQSTTPSRNYTRPCSACGLCADIDLEHGPDIGKVCLFFDWTIHVDELDSGNSAPRRACIEQGNQFTWPVKGLTPVERLKWHHEHNAAKELALKISKVNFLGARIAIAVSVVSLVVATVNIVFTWLFG